MAAWAPGEEIGRPKSKIFNPTRILYRFNPNVRTSTSLDEVFGFYRLFSDDIENLDDYCL